MKRFSYHLYCFQRSGILVINMNLTGENDYKQTSMGVVSKRRDNAEIVKHVYCGVIDILMNQQNLKMSQLISCVVNLINY